MDNLQKCANLQNGRHLIDAHFEFDSVPAGSVLSLAAVVPLIGKCHVRNLYELVSFTEMHRAIATAGTRLHQING